MSEDWMRIFQAKPAKLGRDHSWRLEFDDSIVPNKPSFRWKQCQKSAFARFSCSQCRRGWPSGRAVVVFHMRLAGRQGTVKARPLRQNCKQCSDAPMEEARFSSADINILLDHLMEKIGEKFYDEMPAERDRTRRFKRELDGPHEASHCEACKQGCVHLAKEKILMRCSRP